MDLTGCPGFHGILLISRSFPGNLGYLGFSVDFRRLTRISIDMDFHGFS
jgi:hypothetical protein